MDLTRKLLPVAAIITGILFTLNSCREPRKEISPEEAENYISAYTSGIISAGSSIKVRLNTIPDTWNEDTPPDASILRIKPSTEGKLYLRKFNTLEFVPDEPLSQGKEYSVDLMMHKIFPENWSEPQVFSFNVTVIEQDFTVRTKGLRQDEETGGEKYFFTGELLTADVASIASVEEMAGASIGDRELDIEWAVEQDSRIFSFTIPNINRTNEEQEMILSWDGSSIGVDKEFTDTVRIPASYRFNITSVQVSAEGEQSVTVRFSDQLEKTQNLKGMATISGADNVRISSSGNTLVLYPGERLSGEHKLEVFSGIRNNKGRSLNKDHEYIINFEDLKPEVRLLSKGVILPSSEGLVLNFEAVNLSAIDLSVIKIFEENIPRFLQENRLDGEYQLMRVGRPVMKKRIPLGTEGNVSTGMWKAYSADLSGLIEKDPGAMYRVILSFRKEYSTYTCNGANKETTLVTPAEYDLEEEFGTWDDGSYYNYRRYPSGYRWRERDNPCHVSYYYPDRWATTNLLASDLGIMAKRTEDNSLLFVVTDILTALPLSNIALDVYDYQLQKIETVVTDQKGFAIAATERKPYLLIANKGKQKGYLRLDDGTSLSLSRFDVGGMRVQEGLKGFIYGDRGVWRPGDTVFLNFILYDEKNSLPEGHPVILQLTNPQGQMVERIVEKKNVSGIYSFTLKTEAGAPTGNWNAKVMAGGASFTKRIRIETVKPNRLKIDLDIGGDTVYTTSGKITGTLSSRWLHGATAGNLRAKVDLTLRKGYHTFEGFEEFTFIDPTRRFESFTETIFEDNLDAAGNATIRATVSKAKRAPGLLNASFYSRVFEQGGDFSFDYKPAVYAPFERYIGVKTPEGDRWGRLLTDSTHTVEVVTLDVHGNPVPVSNLEVVIFKVRWRWWWNANDNDLASYYGDDFHEPVVRKTISTGPDGKATIDFSIPYPDWGRFLVHVSDPDGGHAAGKTVYVDWPGFAGRNRGDRTEGASMLAFSVDKEKYQVGDKVAVTFPSTSSGRALMSLENGSEIIDAFWIEPGEGQTEYSFNVTEEMSPNIYVHITLLQPHAQTANDLPIRLYGVQPVMVEDPGTKLEPVIKMPDELSPEEEVTIKVSEEGNRPMGYTIAVVDEGLLDLTSFKTPDPWSTFYAREALGVQSWDVFDHVIGAYAGELTKLMAIGGGLDEEEKGEREVNRFKPVVKFFGPFELRGGEKDEITFTMPNYVGSVRTMVIAAGENAFGSAEKTTPVKKPVMVLATLPRVLGPGEKVKVPVNVFLMEEGYENVTVNIETDGLLEVAGAALEKVTFEKPGDKLVTFSLEVSDNTGTGKVKVSASSNGETAYQEIEIEVRNPNPPLQKSLLRVIEPGETASLDLDLPGMSGTNDVMIEISGQPSVNFGRRLKYLLNYPHGCAEQVTSAAFPQLFLGSVMEVSPVMQSMNDKNIRAAIRKLHRMQMANGGVRYWPQATRADDWATSYAGHFMLEARKKGYTLPYGFVENWVRYQEKAANEWRYREVDFRGYYTQSTLEQAYRLYTLALAGEPQIGAMNRLREEKNTSMQARWRLAAAYALAGQPEIARELIKDLNTEPPEYEYFSSTYGSYLRDRAMILETLILLDKKEQAIPLLLKISEDLRENRWYSTQTTAYALMAVSKFIGEDRSGPDDLVFEIDSEYTGNKQVTSFKPFYQVPIEPGDATNVGFQVSNPGEQDIYLAVYTSGTPLVDRQGSISQNLNMEVRYYDMDGERIEVDKLEQGTDFYARVTVKNPGSMGRLTDMALAQIFPSGWEIINTRLSGAMAPGDTDTPDYQDFRDDRVYTYFDLYIGEDVHFNVLLNAAYLGEFYLPAVSCEAMYDNDVQAREPGKWVEVVLPGNSK